MKSKNIVALILLFAALTLSCKQQVSKLIVPETRSEIHSYGQLDTLLARGWNTFDNRNIMSYVLLPDEFELHLYVQDSVSGEKLYFTFTGNVVKNSEVVKTIAHTPDGSYTNFQLWWKDFRLNVQSVSDGNDLDVLVTPLFYSGLNPGWVIAEAEFPYNNKGDVLLSEDGFQIKTGLRTLSIRALGDVSRNEGQIKGSMKKCVAFSTRSHTLKEVQKQVAIGEEKYWQKKRAYGSSMEAYNIVQNAVNWLVVYDHRLKRLVTPVSRPWSYGWGNGKPGGYVQFCWDNFFASYMHAIESKELAFNEVCQLTRIIDEIGFVPNYAAHDGLYSRDRSQPPVGSLMVKEIYKRYPEHWFLEENFDRLLTWNRWWTNNRDVDGYLCWGSTPFSPAPDKRQKTQNCFAAASNESGLDNTPMYDGVPFDTVKHILPIADVGLMGLYVADCDALAEMAGVLGRKEEARELSQRGQKYRSKLKTMWDDDFGIFLNRRTDTGENSRSISPTNFYALLGKAATQKQAERMINYHFYNPEEFWGEFILPSIARNDPGYTGRDYWRGSIWAPMNFLVYLGLRNYNLPNARKDLADKSLKLLVKNYESKGQVLENYHAETGMHPGYRSDFFYHWGALLGMIDLIENGYMAPTEQSLQ